MIISFSLSFKCTIKGFEQIPDIWKSERMGIFQSSNWILCAFESKLLRWLLCFRWVPESQTTNQPKLWKSPVAFKCFRLLGGKEECQNQLPAFLGLTSMVPAQGPADPPWDWKIFKLQGLVAGGRWASLPSWGVKKCKISGIFDSFFMNALKIHLQKSTLFREQDGTESFFPANVEGYFFGVCAQVGCFERRHEAEIYCILLRCVEGTLGFFCIINLQLWKATKTCDINDCVKGHSFARVGTRRFSRLKSHGVTSATSVWSGSCAVYTSDGIFGAAPWLHQVLGVIRSTFIDRPFAVTVTWFWRISTN